jgi:uncharacterized membrane protein
MSYVLSFVFVGIYWNNHHHLLQATQKVNGRVLWANLHLLFWLSLVPFVTAWMGENHFSSLPVAIYGVVLLLSGVAFGILSQALIRHHGKGSTLAIAFSKNAKTAASLIFYSSAIPLAFFDARISLAQYAIVAAIWLIPDRRIEKLMAAR